jgi:lysine-specific histone demethylase 1
LLELQRAFGDEVVSGLLHSHLTRWDHDEFARGSYLFCPIGTEPERVNELAQPVDNIHFAGDATDLDYLGSMLGAHRSGHRVASQVEAKFVDV